MSYSLSARLSRFARLSSPPGAMTTAAASVAAAATAAGAYTLYVRRYGSAQAETAAGATKPPFASIGFHTLTLASSERVNHNVKRLRFALPDPAVASGLPLTSALLTISFPGGGWWPVVRPYTPVGDLDAPGFIEFLVKQYPGGKQSSHLHAMRPGDRLTFFRIPAYRWTANEQPHVGLVAGGQGITPCYQLLRGILRNPADRTRVTLVWGVNGDADVLPDIKDGLAALQAQHPGRLTVHCLVSHPDAGSPYTTGRITEDVLRQAGIRPADVGKVFLSGPPAMEKALAARGGTLAKLGFARAQTHTF